MAAYAGRRLHRLERAALQGVMVREIVNFSSFWRSSTFSSTVDPTIYLLAFGLGLGSTIVTVFSAATAYVILGAGTIAALEWPYVRGEAHATAERRLFRA